MNLRLKRSPIDISILLDNNLWLTIALALCLVGVIGSRLANLSNKSTIGHDESWSYLSATCQLADIRSAEATSEPVPVSEWKGFLEVEQPFCFGQISDGLAQYDKHPPFYFWMLHLWTLLFGVNPSSGPALNIVFAVLTVLVLYRLASITLKNRSEAMLVVITYAFGFGTIRISQEARQYDLLVLIAVLCVWQVIRLTHVDKPVKIYQLLFLTVTVTIGALTHYHFVISISAGIVFAIARLIKSDPIRLIQIILATIFGYALAFLVFPLHLVALRQQANVAVEASLSEFGGRLLISILSFYQYMYILLIMLGAVIVLSFRGNRKFLERLYQETDFSGSYILFFFFWIATWTILLYLALRSPRHAMSEKYLIMAWPFFAFLPVFLLRLFRHRSSLSFYFYLVPLVFVLTIPWIGLSSEGVDRTGLQAKQNLVIIDNTEPGILPQIIWDMPDDQLVIIGNQTFLLENSSSWLKYLADGDLYVSELSYGDNSKQKQKELFLLIQEAGFKLMPAGQLPLEGQGRNYAPIYRLLSQEQTTNRS